ncbi:hypothetical protein [Landjia virus]|uniref:Uncharacterized protein n=1 Tax=Landjia virus TaxID=1272947 RepID=A0A0D3R189_9RHAB|nr:hypothetical protein [Landjia virus]AJR28489.1 hypothetical protein [Landjia virus]
MKKKMNSVQHHRNHRFFRHLTPIGQSLLCLHRNHAQRRRMISQMMITMNPWRMLEALLTLWFMCLIIYQLERKSD